MNNTDSEIEESARLLAGFEKRGGLLPVVVQESSSGLILMVASVNREALDFCLKNKKPAFWSTSRGELWIKGETSGNTLLLDQILIDCDQDALIYKVTQEKGGVCHTTGNDGNHRKSCFYREIDIDTKTLRFL